jgi:hypothetical protein
MTERRLDLPTVIAIAAVCHIAATVVHEALGHGLVALAFGAHVQHVSSVDLAYDESTVGAIPNRIIAAAGPLANIVAGALALVLASRWTPASGAHRFALWLFGHINLWIGAGYALALSFASFGDIQAIVAGLPMPLAFRVALTAAGLAVSIWTGAHAARTLMPFVGVGADRGSRAIRLTLVPYLTMGLVAVTAGALNPDSPMLIVISAGAASFGGNAFLAWLPQWMRRARGGDAEPIGIERSRSWIGVALVVLLFLYIGLAPGLPR